MGLHLLEQISPDFMKLDISLIRGIENDSLRRELITSLLKFCQKIGAHAIAEGIETEEEFETLRDLGVPFGQGYYFAYPAEF